MCAYIVLRLVYGRLLPQAGQGKIGSLAIPIAVTSASLSNTMTIAIVLLGLVAGVLVGLLGIGGGVVLVPAMVYFLHMDQHLAQGTSLFILLPPIGLGAFLQYWKQGQVELRAGILCALGMLFGGYAGSLIAVPMPSRHLKGTFGCFLMLAAFLLWRKTKGDSNRAAAGSGQVKVHA